MTIGATGSGTGLSDAERVLRPVAGQSRAAALAFGLLAALYLLTFGPVTWKLAIWAWPWTHAVLLMSVLMLGGASSAAIGSGSADATGRLLTALNGLLGCLILVAALVHWIALKGQPPYQTVNVAGVSVGSWIPQHWYFTSVYLLFPILLLALYLLIGRLRLDVVARTIAVCLAMSVAVQYYQGLVDWSFLNNWGPGSGRTGGLATDPNAYQLITFLLVPVVIALGSLDRSKTWRLVSGSVAMLAVVGLLFAGGRTAVGGVVLLVILSPLILAIALRQWSIWARVLLSILPFVILVAGALVATEMAADIQGLGVLGRRVADSIERFSSDGLRGLLFDRELRGFFWQMGWLLLLRSPFAGWGAGGFLREYQNEAFRQTGAFPSFIDYVSNHYLMVPIDLGIPALLVQIGILIAALFVGFRALRHLDEPRARLALTILLVSQVIFLLMIVVAPPYFSDAIFAWTLSLALLFVIARRLNVVPIRLTRVSGVGRKVSVGVVGALVLGTAIGSFSVTFGSEGYRMRLDAVGSPLRYERNCYSIEQHGADRKRWCGRNARVKLPLPAKGSDKLVVGLMAGNPDLQQNPLTVSYGGLAGPTQNLTLANPPSAEIRIPLDADHVVEIPRPDGKGVDRFVVLSFDVSRTWVPKEWRVNADPRELGVLVKLPAGTP